MTGGLQIQPECSDAAATTTTTARCAWCGAGYVARPNAGGGPRRFCSDDCRAALHREARRWALAEIDAGRLTVADLKGQRHRIRLSHAR